MGTDTAVRFAVKSLPYSLLHLLILFNSIRLRNDLYCVGWGVKLYSLTHSLFNSIDIRINTENVSFLPVRAVSGWQGVM